MKKISNFFPTAAILAMLLIGCTVKPGHPAIFCDPQKDYHEITPVVLNLENTVNGDTVAVGVVEYENAGAQATKVAMGQITIRNEELPPYYYPCMRQGNLTVTAGVGQLSGKGNLTGYPDQVDVFIALK